MGWTSSPPPQPNSSVSAIARRNRMAHDLHMAGLRQWWRARRARRGRILAVKLGYNPNSSSLGVDVTFLLFGMAAVALLTPIVGLLVRSRRIKPPAAAAPAAPAAGRSAPASPGS